MYFLDLADLNDFIAVATITMADSKSLLTALKVVFVKVAADNKLLGQIYLCSCICMEDQQLH